MEPVFLDEDVTDYDYCGFDPYELVECSVQLVNTEGSTSQVFFPTAHALCAGLVLTII
jgi:hypothetical protein